MNYILKVLLSTVLSLFSMVPGSSILNKEEISRIYNFAVQRQGSNKILTFLAPRYQLKSPELRKGKTSLLLDASDLAYDSDNKAMEVKNIYNIEWLKGSLRDAILKSDEQIFVDTRENCGFLEDYRQSEHNTAIKCSHFYYIHPEAAVTKIFLHGYSGLDYISIKNVLEYCVQNKYSLLIPDLYGYSFNYFAGLAFLELFSKDKKNSEYTPWAREVLENYILRFTWNLCRGSEESTLRAQRIIYEYLKINPQASKINLYGDSAGGSVVQGLLRTNLAANFSTVFLTRPLLYCIGNNVNKGFKGKINILFCATDGVINPLIFAYNTSAFNTDYKNLIIAEVQKYKKQKLDYMCLEYNVYHSIPVDVLELEKYMLELRPTLAQARIVDDPKR